LPVGFVWGEQDGEVLFHPDEAVTGAIRTVFERFVEFGSARRVWLWFRSEGLSFPLQNGPAGQLGPIRWVVPTYTALHHVLTNPVYAGAYAYGKTRCERYVDEQGVVRKRMRHLPIDQWAVLIPDHHPGFIDWATFQANQGRLDSNTRPKPHQSGGAVREGSALLQGIATCGHCGRRLMTHYRGRNSTPGYHCAGKDIVDGRGQYCLTIGGLAIEQAVANAFLEAVTPAAVEATMLSVQQLQANHDAALSQWRLEVERARYQAERAERQYRTVEPENRLVARGLETEWEKRLRDLAAAEAELRRREQQRPNPLGPEQLNRIQILGSDIRQVWNAPAITDRDRKELLRTLLEEVILDLKRAEGIAHLTLRWRGGASTLLDVPVPRFRPMGPRTDEDTISLLRRLAALYPDEVIAGILNRQDRKTATGERFIANHVGNLPRHRNVPRYQPPAEPPTGELVSSADSGMNTSTIRLLTAGPVGLLHSLLHPVYPGAPSVLLLAVRLLFAGAHQRRGLLLLLLFLLLFDGGFLVFGLFALAFGRRHVLLNRLLLLFLARLHVLGALARILHGQIQAVVGGLNRLRQREGVTLHILRLAVLRVLQHGKHFLLDGRHRGQPEPHVHLAANGIVRHIVDGVEDFGVVLQRVMDQDRPPGLLFREQAPHHINALLGETSVELEAKVGLLRFLNLVGFIGGQKIALRGQGRRQQQTTHANFP
jgi:hypothetical protein